MKVSWENIYYVIWLYMEEEMIYEYTNKVSTLKEPTSQLWVEA